ncbi:MAG: hypothetical protein J0H91_02235 [Rhodospirillales bacterium]|nr:hypothetical protein [Rhodospirillales bacterium]
MTPAARIAAAIELLAAIEGAPRKPADAVANDFFRNRRFIGSGDRRAISERTWGVIRARRRLDWWLQQAGARTNPRLLVAAQLLLTGWSLDGVAQSFSGGQFGPTHLSQAEKAMLGGLETHTLDHPAMPELGVAASARPLRRRSGRGDGGDGRAGAARPAGEHPEGQP